MTFDMWEPKRRTEQQYLTALQKLKWYILKNIKDTDEIDAIPDKIAQLSTSSALFDWSRSISKTMVTNTLSQTARTWRQAARESGRSRQMYSALQADLNGAVGTRAYELIDSNAQYIHSVPAAVAKDLTKFLSSQAYADTRATYNMPEFKAMIGKMTENHAKLIARTETAKSHAAINQAQAEDLGLDWYIWRATGDVRTRDSHKHMDNVLCRYSDPPSPEKLDGKKSVGSYGPGNIFNCRCYDSPVILWRTVSWPHKVHDHGAITTMTKQAFIEKFKIAA